MTKIAVVVSHPIQHFCPQYSSWAKLAGVELRVLFASDHGLKPYEDKNFARKIQWEDLDLDFPHEFLPGGESRNLGVRIDSPLLGARLAEYSPDAVIVYGYAQALQRRAIAWCKKTKIPILMISDSELRSRRSRTRRLAKALLLPRILRNVSLFLTVGDANDAYYRHYGVTDDKLIRCFFPIDAKHYDRVLRGSDDARHQVRSELGIPAEHIVIMMVGKMVPWKRQVDLVRFSNSIQASRADITVVFAGAGPDEAKLKALVKRHGPGGVVFAGFVMPTKLAEYYCASDIYAHCSTKEPHSLAVSEAIYCGLPVVISDCCGSYGPSDDVRVGLNGYVYRCGDVVSLSSALFQIIDSNVRRGLMRSASSEIARCNQRLAHGRALEQALNCISSFENS